ncbi:nucleotide exchange factor GrpE [Clostridium sp. CX1]|uniref:nucleotide exchange factor GrpE n=1 Tax=Clostridium sp. CX1 TaxID=2978346 RepID=UPI0021BE76D3|nr:nucleotide exchange factor GrpE [Clostridium sp. CX1]MCT8976255.1 nucleotide exchange factor GrpE [Clostridium sp. CX1]
MFNNRDKKVEDQKETVKGVAEENITEENSTEENLEENTIEETENAEVTEDENLAENTLEVLKEENKKLSDENTKIKGEVEALKDRLSRMTAEYDNFRKRTAKEKEGIYTDACEDVLKGILPVLDNLERAISVEGSIEDLKKGIEMTIKQFNNALEGLNVEEISTEGEFDPHVHNAVMHIDDEQYGKNQVVEVFQKGYKRGDKVLRYSVVKVAN